MKEKRNDACRLADDRGVFRRAGDGCGRHAPPSGDEINGLMTYDRKVLKYNPAVLKAAHEAIIRRASESAKENREEITP